MKNHKAFILQIVLIYLLILTAFILYFTNRIDLYNRKNQLTILLLQQLHLEDNIVQTIYNDLIEDNLIDKFYSYEDVSVWQIIEEYEAYYKIIIMIESIDYDYSIFIDLSKTNKITRFEYGR